MIQFKIGMRVLCEGDMTYVEGKKGTVKEIKNDDYIGVEFDESNPMLHNLGGICPMHKGYYVHPNHLKPLDDFIENWEDIPNQVKNK